VGWKIFAKDKVDGVSTTVAVPSNNILEDFESRVGNLRTLLLELAQPRTQDVWTSRFTRAYPEYTFAGGRKVLCPDDFVDAYATEAYDNQMRGMVNFVQNSMWGNSNAWAVRVEKKVMQMLKLRYSKVNCLNEKLKKVHLGGSIKQAIVRQKQSKYVNRFRKAGKKFHQEILYKRKVQLPKDVVRVVQATFQSHGFNGLIGICAGHPSLLAAEMTAAKSVPPVTPATPAVPRAPQQPLSALQAWFQSKMSSGFTTKEELRKEMEREEAEEATIVTGRQSFVSPMRTPAENQESVSTCEFGFLLGLVWMCYSNAPECLLRLLCSLDLTTIQKVAWSTA
jgi:hypothetical protein